MGTALSRLSCVDISLVCRMSVCVSIGSVCVDSYCDGMVCTAGASVCVSIGIVWIASYCVWDSDDSAGYGLLALVSRGRTFPILMIDAIASDTGDGRFSGTGHVSSNCCDVSPLIAPTHASGLSLIAFRYFCPRTLPRIVPMFEVL